MDNANYMEDIAKSKDYDFYDDDFYEAPKKKGKGKHF